MGVGAVADDLRADEDDQFGARGDLPWCPKASPRAGIWSSPGMPLRVPCCCSLIRPASSTVWPLATEIELLTFRSETVGVRLLARCRRNVADLLLDIEPDVAVDVDPRRHPQDDAGVAVIDGVHDGIAGGQHGGAAGGDRYLVADLQRRDLVVDDDQRGIGQHLDVVTVCSASRMKLGWDSDPIRKLNPGNARLRNALVTDPATEAMPVWDRWWWPAPRRWC